MLVKVFFSLMIFLVGVLIYIVYQTIKKEFYEEIIKNKKVAFILWLLFELALLLLTIIVWWEL